MLATNLDEGPKIRVMLVDESTLFLRAVTFFLQQYPDVQVVGTLCCGAQAVAQAQLLNPEIVLLDWSLHELSGLHLIAQLRAARPDIHIVVITLLDIDASRKAALAAGAAAFVSKVSATTDLISTIRNVAQAHPSEALQDTAL